MSEDGEDENERGWLHHRIDQVEDLTMQQKCWMRGVDAAITDSESINQLVVKVVRRGREGVSAKRWHE